jgi:hypothetical protein
MTEYTSESIGCYYVYSEVETSRKLLISHIVANLLEIPSKKGLKAHAENIAEKTVWRYDSINNLWGANVGPFITEHQKFRTLFYSIIYFPP